MGEMRPSVNARSLRTKSAVAGEFARHGSGYVLVGLLVATSAWRVRSGKPLRVADARALAAVLAIQPFFEWTVHRGVLHGPPREVAGRSIDPGAPHRGHHRVPDDVAGALLGTSYAVSNGLAVSALAGGVGRLFGSAGAGALAGQLGLLGYEWTHLLSHSGYQPRTAWFRHLRAAHLRHHFRDERTNYGVTSRLADRVFRTAA